VAARVAVSLSRRGLFFNSQQRALFARSLLGSHSIPYLVAAPAICDCLPSFALLRALLLLACACSKQQRALLFAKKKNFTPK